MEDALSFYREHGYWVEPEVFSAAECDALIEAGRELAHFREGNTRPAMMPHREDPRFLAALRAPKVVARIEQFVGGRADGLQTEFFYCKPGTRGFSTHQDNFFVEAPMGVFASAWVALTDTHPDKGGLIVYPGTHKEGLLPVRKVEVVIPPQYPPFHASVPKGAALFIHGHLVHGSNTNRTDEWRYVLLSTYIRQGEPFRAGNYARRAPVAL
jgi:ectoine hydroxylase-related dioxygenase (phytanoyl-CoA dioxygenase family)